MMDHLIAALSTPPKLGPAIRKYQHGTLQRGDCLEIMKQMPDRSVDLVICSPPYEAARTYDIGFNLRGEDWVKWAKERFIECVRICKGLVCWVVEGQTRQYRYSASPILLAADLHRAGVHLRKPPIYHRVGIPGSGGPDWWRNDWEFCICATNGGKLPWSNNTATGHPPIYQPGGPMSNRTKDGQRVANRITRRHPNGDRTDLHYTLPTLANPGNVIKCVVGGSGKIGHELAHDNEAPFPEDLVYPFIVSFCPPDGTVLDCFSGSGTTASVAMQNGRRYFGIDTRESQIVLAERRIGDIPLKC